MSGDAAAARRKWVVRVLGVTLPDGQAPDEGGPAARGLAVVAALRGTIDQQIIAVQEAFRALDDTRGATIVRQGITPLAVRLHVALDAIAASLQTMQATPGGGAEKPALAAIASLRKQVEGDPGVAYLERNPFGIAVAIRAATEQAAADLAAILAEV